LLQGAVHHRCNLGELHLARLEPRELSRLIRIENSAFEDPAFDRQDGESPGGIVEGLCRGRCIAVDERDGRGALEHPDQLV
jgi:hypothetical protein